MREMERGATRGHNERAEQRLDPDYAPNVEVFDNLGHQEIYDNVQSMNPATLLDGQQAWQSTATAVGDAVNRAHSQIGAAIADGWRGDAAEAAAATIRDFERAGKRLADVMAAVGQRLGGAADAAETLRQGVPEPYEAHPDLPGALLDPVTASDNVAMQRGAEDSRQDVVRVMNSVYRGAFIPSGSGVPAFPGIAHVPGAPDTTTATEAPPSNGPTAVPGSETGTGSTPGRHPQEAQDPMAATGTGPAAANQPTTTATPPLAPTVSETNGATTTPAPSTTETTPATTTATTPGNATAPAPLSAPPAGSGTQPPVTAPAATPTAMTVPSSDDKRKSERDRENQQGNAGSQAVTGMGAGAVGGMMGGAFAASDTPRSGPSIPTTSGPSSRNTEPADELDDDLHFTDDDLTFLEPSEENGELIGTIDPTTPPVLGEWTEQE